MKKDGFYNKIVKRRIDFFISLILILALSPLLIILIVVGVIAMKGNPFFVQERPGKIDKRTGKEKIFRLIKFRTMTNEKDKDGNLLPDDKRLNKFGRFLRQTSLDELGELINILKGDMAFIGPRPLLVRYLDRYSEEQRHRHDVRPGLTGYAQAHGRNSLSWDEKFKLDVYYVENVSFLMDVRIVIDTIKAVLCRTGISSETCDTMEEFWGN